MLVDEVTVSTVWRQGQLQDALAVLARARLEVQGLSSYVQDGSAKDQRVIRFILSDPVEGAAALKRAGYSVRVAPVLLVDRPPLLFDLELAFGKLAQAGIVLDAAYGVHGPDGPRMALVTTDPQGAEELVAEVLRPRPTTELAEPSRRPPAGRLIQ